MIITKLILHKYNRLFLNNITTLTYTPESPTQILLGENGSGKSSLLSQLSPLPADLKKDFGENGYKYIEIEHNGKLYTLSSGYIEHNKHSFILDNIELNPSGLKTTQLELVKEHFSITPYIYNIILGINKFSSMSTAERKKIFIDISHIDYDYAISIYNKLKTRNRDIVGGIKILQNNIVKLNSETLPEDDINSYKTMLRNITEYIEYLISNYVNVTYEHSTEDILSAIAKANKDITKTLTTLNSLTMSNVTDIENKINVLQGERNGIINNINTIKNRILKIEDSDVTVSDKSKYEDELFIVNNRITELTNSVYVNMDLSNAPTIYATLTDQYPYIIELLSSLAEYDSVDSSSVAIKNLSNEYTKYKLMLSTTNHKINTNRTKLEYLNKLKSDNNVAVCEKCNHSWIFGYDENEEKNTKLELDSLGAKASEYETVVNKLSDDINNVETKLSIINNIVSLSNNIVVRDTWDYIWQKNVIGVKTNVAIIDFQKLYTDLNNWCNYTTYVKERDNLLVKLDKINAIDILIADENKTNLANLESDLLSNTSKLNLISGEIKELSDIKSCIMGLEAQYTKAKHYLKELHKNRNKDTLSAKNDYIRKFTTSLKQETMRIDTLISNSRLVLEKITAHQKDIQELNLTDKVTDILAKELSPTEGLIAKSINSFLSVFVGDMNNIISSIWNYPMVLRTCDISANNDLDYKFPVHVNDANVIEDISKTSTAMQEVIDLAFRIVYTRYLNIADVPLFLDEYGRSFDPQHRINAYNVIDNIFTNTFDQIFIVSHFESMYGRFNNCDINIIKDHNGMYNNIVKYNDTLTII